MKQGFETELKVVGNSFYFQRGNPFTAYLKPTASRTVRIVPKSVPSSIIPDIQSDIRTLYGYAVHHFRRATAERKLEAGLYYSPFPCLICWSSRLNFEQQVEDEQGYLSRQSSRRVADDREYKFILPRKQLIPSPAQGGEVAVRQDKRVRGDSSSDSSSQGPGRPGALFLQENCM